MQKSKKISSREDDCVRESWEELEEDLDHMAVVSQTKYSIYRTCDFGSIFQEFMSSICYLVVT